MTKMKPKECQNIVYKKVWQDEFQKSVVLSVVPRTICRDLAALQKKGVLVREGNTSAGRWVLLADIK